MNSYEIMLRTLEFSGPERVAHSFEPADMVMASPYFANPEVGWQRVTGLEQAWERTDEWGNLWRGRGGFVAGYYSDEASINLEPRWQQIAIDEFLLRGKRLNIE